jgi:hypothetical protein
MVPGPTPRPTGRNDTWPPSKAIRVGAHVQFVVCGLFTGLITTKTPRWESQFTKNAFYFIFEILHGTRAQEPMKSGH